MRDANASTVASVEIESRGWQIQTSVTSTPAKAVIGVVRVTIITRKVAPSGGQLESRSELRLMTAVVAAVVAVCSIANLRVPRLQWNMMDDMILRRGSRTMYERWRLARLWSSAPFAAWL
jgi:hypothetical protein